jgi:tRNA nucleotidyltransferase (CCA-adding enzyme)
MPEVRIDDIGAELSRAYPELDAIQDAAGGKPVDLVVEGDATALATRLGGEVREHERFATAKVHLGEHEVDIATARAESYPHPGALPEVEPTEGIAADLARRDFTINAMAVPLRRDPELIDPHRGREDLEAGLLRVLHPHSFDDDPTRALRAARYAARFGFELEHETAELLREANLDTVSADRREAELLRLAGETEAVRGFALLGEWGLVEPPEHGVELAAGVAGLLAEPPWMDEIRRDRAILAAVRGHWGEAEKLAAANPQRPSLAVELAARHDPVELVLARALGAEWLDRWLTEWRSVKLEIDGEDLKAAGVPQGHAIGRGLKEALIRKLDGEVSGREEELRVALEAARWADER